MKLQCTLSSGAKVYKWTYTGTLTAIPTGIIFTYDGGQKYNNTDGTFRNHGYYTASSPQSAVKTVSKTKEEVTAISQVSGVGQKTCVIYNLRGQRVAEVKNISDAEYLLKSGIYVCNGKKFVIR